MSFQIGSYITGTTDTFYSITNTSAFMQVINVCESGEIEVKVLGKAAICGEKGLSETYDVDSVFFREISVDDFMALYNDNVIWSDEFSVDEYIEGTKKDRTDFPFSDVMETVETESYVLSDEERNKLIKEIGDLLTEYDHDNTPEAIGAIVDEWVKNKGWIIKLMENHPNYNGKYQIVFDHDFERRMDEEVVEDFMDWCYRNLSKCFEEIKYEGKTFMEWRQTYVREIGENSAKAYKIMSDMEDKYYIYDGKAYPQMFYTLRRLFDRISRWKVDTTLTKEQADELNGILPDLRLNGGMKFSRVVNKICGIATIDKAEEYNHNFAAFADAINPLNIKRHTIISVNPKDYLTMSFGNSWSSCHTIDKSNKRGMENGYRGMYCGGTESYMLDGASIVFYLVDKSYEGNEYELQPKISRNMFHLGKDKIVQGRVYPQANDGDDKIYREYREIVQKVISDCLDVPNLWKNNKGIGECCSVIKSDGVHYRDYANFNSCNVSYLNVEGTQRNIKKIIVGHYPICPNCGKLHDRNDNVNCNECDSDENVCYDCGRHFSDEDELYLCDDGEYRCEDCCFWCEYHERYEARSATDVYYVCDYGDICDTAYESGAFGACDWCEDIYKLESMIVTENGKCFCCESHAKRKGYIECDNGEWWRKDDTFVCDYCKQRIHYGVDSIETVDGNTYCCEYCAEQDGYCWSDTLGKWVLKDCEEVS